MWSNASKLLLLLEEQDLSAAKTKQQYITMNCSLINIPQIPCENSMNIISLPMTTAKWKFIGLFKALNFSMNQGHFFLWPMNFFEGYFHDKLIQFPLKVTRINFMTCDFLYILLSWPISFPRKFGAPWTAVKWHYFHRLTTHLLRENKINGPWTFTEIHTRVQWCCGP